MAAAKLPMLRVATHQEGAIRNVVVKVHGRPPDANGEVDPRGNPTFVQFACAGDPAARLRVEIRNGAAIVYREEVQLPISGGSYDSGLRYFAL